MIRGSEKNKRFSYIFAWGLYDLANQFFALNMVSLYFVRWVTIEKATPDIFYSIFFAISAFLTATAAPILGTISDITRRRMVFLVYLTLISVIFTVLLGICSNVFLGLTLFIFANFGCQTAVIFYNSILVDIAPEGKIGMVSGFGKMLGYAGAVIALYLMRPIVLQHGYQATFLPTGVFFLIFALPCLILIKDKDPRRDIYLRSFIKKDRILEVFKRIKILLSDSTACIGLIDFLKAIFFSMSAVNAVIIFMAVYATRVFQIDENQIIQLLILSTLFAMTGSMVSGYISDRLGPLRMLMIIFVLWGLSFSFGAFVSHERFFWLIGALVGLALGSTWAVLRAAGIRLVPKEMIGELFGLFNIVGYLSGAVGALFWGGVVSLFSSLGQVNYRIALFSLNIFLILASIFLVRLYRYLPKEKRGSSSSLDSIVTDNNR